MAHENLRTTHAGGAGVAAMSEINDSRSVA